VLAAGAGNAAAEPALRIAGVDHASSANVPPPPSPRGCQQRFNIRCYTPAQLRRAYDMGPLLARHVDGAGRTIVILDSFGSPTLRSDLRTFDRAFHLPDPPSLRIYQPVGRVPRFGRNPSEDQLIWATETTLDVEWSHVFAPAARIVVLETPVDETEGTHGMPQMMGAVRWAIKHHVGDLISMSWGATEQTFPSARSIRDLRTTFVQASRHRLGLVAASGDTGAAGLKLDRQHYYAFRTTQWPPSDPLVLAAGGTRLTLDAGGRRTSPDVAWNDSGGATGGGRSSVFARPSYQRAQRHVVGAHRGLPDISMSAATEAAAEVYTSFDGGPSWQLIGGTSLATVELAGVVADADQLAHHAIIDLPARLYSLRHRGSAGIVDVTRGNNTFPHGPGRVRGFAAGRGYDLTTGFGTIDAAKFIPAFAAG